MLETIREYAGERLEAAGEVPDLHRRHAEHFLTLAQRLASHLPVTREWLDEIEAEHDNVRAALDRLGAVGETQLAQLLAEAIWRFWKLRGHQAESQRRFDALLAADDRPTSARAHALNAAAGMAVENNDYLTGRHYAEEALAIHEERGDAWGTARSFYMLGYAAIESGDFETAMPLFEKTVELLTDLGYEHFAGMATFNLAWACEELGDVARAKELTEQNLVRARSIGSPALEATALVELAAQARDEGRNGEALSLTADILRIHVDLGDVPHQLDTFSRFAFIHAKAGHAELAAQLLAASLALHEELGLNVPLYQQGRNEEIVSLLHEQLGESTYADASELGRALTLDGAIALALGEAD